MKKLIAIGIIFLFIGVAVAPSINSTGNQTKIVSDNHPPNDPEITGPSKGKVGITYVFTIVTTDPENQNVSYYIEWGDGTHTGWTYYHKSGQYVSYSHTWYKINESNLVRCKAKDVYNAESNWSYMDIPITENSEIIQSSNNDLVEVTSQACGIQGFGNTTVKLTKQQYQDLQNYLVDFSARLNQTTTREEAVPIFKDAVVELNKYGLLPKGMTLPQAQRLVLGQRFIALQKLVQRHINKNSNNFTNTFCLTFIHSTSIGMMLQIPLVLWPMLLFFNYGWLLVLMYSFLPLTLSLFSSIYLSGFSGWAFTFGLLGFRNLSDYSELFLRGFTGIKIMFTSPYGDGRGYIIGWTLAVTEY